MNSFKYVASYVTEYVLCSKEIKITFAAAREAFNSKKRKHSGPLNNDLTKRLAKYRVLSTQADTWTLLRKKTKEI